MPTQKPITRRFREFHEANPEVYRLFKFYALQLWNSGHRKGGAKMIWERLRWEFMRKHATNGTNFKLPNDFTADYARMLADELPQFSEFFSFRQRPAVDRALEQERREQASLDSGLWEGDAGPGTPDQGTGASQ